MYSTVETVGGESAAADFTSDIEAQTIESLLLIHYSFFMFVCVCCYQRIERALN